MWDLFLLLRVTGRRISDTILLSCTKCGRYKRGDFAFYEYWTTVDMNHPVSVKLNEEQIKELGLVPGKDKEY